MKTYLKKPIFLLLILLNFNFSGFSQNDRMFEVMKNLEIFSTIFKHLHLHYVEEIQPGELMKVGIDAMLQSLDPYTVFIPEAQIEDLRLFTDGSYEGVGMVILSRKGKTIISEIYEGFPAHQAGLLAGDQILSVNGVDISNRTSSEVSVLLRGQPNTSLTLTIQRIDESSPIEKTMIRSAIRFDNVSYAAMLAENIAYIKLDGFTEGAANEVREAFLRLRDEGATSLILDLRGNGGGLMNEAADIVNLFVDRGLPVVSVRGRVHDRNQTLHTRNEPIDRDIPIVVLIDRGSASASEIVAGALQDYDRAVIIGQRSFGKGLVQNILPLDYNAQLKITTARYHIPSGRCIQAFNFADRDEDGRVTRTPDSLRTAFQTRGGRTVYDGDGIEPDIELDPPTLSNITAVLFTRLHFFDFANQFRRQNPSIPNPSEFVVSDELFNEFITFLDGRDIEYQTQTEFFLEELTRVAQEENYFDAIREALEFVRKKLEADKEADLIKHKSEIKKVLGLEIVSRYYFHRGATEFALRSDDVSQKAIEILQNLERYRTILRQ
ncbi:MAG: S41 family peptidase [Bacteroidales bacterium]|nr:S41 family peptidase [Bacteroidales bacterium]